MPGAMKPIIYALAILAFANSQAMAFDTCIYLDTAGAVLRITAKTDAADLTQSDGSVISCKIVPAPSTDTVRSGTCQDRPEQVFPVFTGASDPSMTEEDDILVFRNELWYRKCAFVR